MSYTYDLSTTVGLIRLNTFRNTDKTDPLFIDEELSALYTQERSNVKRASARVLEIVAANELFVQKVIKLLQLSTDGAKVADSFLKLASALRAQADEEQSTEGDTSGFDIAEQVFDQFGVDERLLKQGLRGVL